MRVFATTFSDVAVTAQQDLFELLPVANKPVRIIAAFITQLSDVGDAAEEMLRIAIIRGYTSSGSGGSAGASVPMDSNQSAAACSVEVNNTTVATTGTGVVLHSETFNIRTGWAYIPVPEARPRVQNAETMVVRLLTTPADSLTMSGTLIYCEE